MVQYDVEHLATFSTASSHEQQVGAATTQAADATTKTAGTGNAGDRIACGLIKAKDAK